MSKTYSIINSIKGSGELFIRVRNEIALEHSCIRKRIESHDSMVHNNTLLNKAKIFKFNSKRQTHTPAIEQPLHE